MRLRQLRAAASPGRLPAQDPATVRREDAIGALASLMLMLGLLVDGWNHINLQNGALGGFFTPWHGLLYAGFTASAVWVITRNPHLYLEGREAQPYYHRVFGIPMRYPLAMAGIALATVGVAGDAGWHTAFGEEEGVARVIAPFHLLLFAGAALLVAAPLRSGWHAPHIYPRDAPLRVLFAPLLSLALVTSLMAFMFQWLSAFLLWEPSLQLGNLPPALASHEAAHGTAELAGAARILVTNVILLSPIFLALRRWSLPFGSVTTVWTFVAVYMATLTEFRLGASIVGAIVGGLVADALIVRLHPDETRHLAFRVIGGVVPAALWTTYFAATAWIHGLVWPVDLWIGTIGVAAMTGIALSFLAVPIGLPEGLRDMPSDIR